MRIEVMISGFGGQGIVLAGSVLSQAAVLAGYKAAATYTYGPEARLGSTKSDVIISDEEIDYPKVISPDYWIVMNQISLNNFSKKYDISKTVLIVDTAFVRHLDDVRDRVKAIYEVPASQEAEKLGNRLVANMLMLGYFVTISGLFSIDHLKEAIRRIVKPKFIELNLKAVDRGKELAERALKEVRV